MHVYVASLTGRANICSLPLRVGYHVLLVYDGEEAVQQFGEHQHEIDLVVLDVIMPKLRGPDAYSQMSTLRPGLPVIFCTGYNADTPLVSAAIKTATIVVQKPYTTKILAQQVRMALEKAHQA